MNLDINALHLRDLLDLRELVLIKLKEMKEWAEQASVYDSEELRIRGKLYSYSPYHKKLHVIEVRLHEYLDAIPDH